MPPLERRCHICREECDAEPRPIAESHTRILKVTCDRCVELVGAPTCGACGKRVRDASKKDQDVYHENCRRCSSCSQVVPKQEMVKLAGRILCSSCDHLFGRFFVPGRRPHSERMKDAFKVWDRDNSGTIEVDELKGVMKGLNPNFPDRDLDKIMRVMDRNSNGVIEYEEFVEWVMSGSPLDAGDQSFQAFVAQLMRDAGAAAQKDDQEIAEVQVRNNGIVFRLRSGKEKIEATSIRSDSTIELVMVEPEEFINKVEFTEAGLRVSMNTGRLATVDVHGAPFGPWVAPEGFQIVGLRVKPVDDGPAFPDIYYDGPVCDRIVGLDLAPLCDAKSYDTATALRFAAEHEYLHTLRSMLSKAAVDLNSFGPGGVTALMLAAQEGSIGSIRLLISSKAGLDVQDGDGWTALTYASSFGHATAVDLLLEKGATEKGDGCAALKEAMRNSHNSAARSLLRAGLGPAKQGTFQLEDRPPRSKMTLATPVATPEGSVFHGSVTVELCWPPPEKPQDEAAAGEGEAEDEEAQEASGEGADAETGDAAADEGTEDASEALMSRRASARFGEAAHIVYTLDGRDPFLAGRRYRGPLTFTEPFTHLRAVAVQGADRSEVLSQIFVVCHYAIPEEVVKGSMQIRTFPESAQLIECGVAKVLGVTPERCMVETSEAEKQMAYGTWVRWAVADPAPRHSLKVNQSFTMVRGKENLNKFVSKLSDDIENAVGVKPQRIIVSADHRAGQATFRAGCILVELTLPRKEAEDVCLQLQNDRSFLRMQGKHRQIYADAKLELLTPLGDRLMTNEFADGMVAELRAKAPKFPVKEILGVGSGDTGTVAILMTGGSKVPKAVVKQAIATTLTDYPDLEIDNPVECPEELTLDFTIDVITTTRGGVHYSAADVVDELNDSEFNRKLTSVLAKRRFDVQIESSAHAHSRSLSQLEFFLEWDGKGDVPEGPEGMCLVYTGSDLVQLIDWRSGHEDLRLQDAVSKGRSEDYLRSIGRAVKHTTGDEHPGEHRISADLDAMPLDVTDMFFVVAAPEGKDLAQYANTRVRVQDSLLGRELTEYNIGTPENSEAMVMCSLTKEREHNKWVVHGLSLPTTGGFKDTQQILSVLAEHQQGFLSWDRRKTLVTLRALHRLKRISKNATNQFAQLLWSLLDLPVPAFQMVVKYF